MHSSRMRTARLLTISRCARRELSAGGCIEGCLHGGGGCLRRGFLCGIHSLCGQNSVQMLVKTLPSHKTSKQTVVNLFIKCTISLEM